MRKRIALAVFALLVMVAPLGIVAGSTVTGALYKMVVTIGNVGTAATNVATTCNLSAPNLIAGGYVNATVTNIALQDATGSDVPFMPGHDTNPWVLWVPSIGESSYDQNVLYLAESSGGKIRYFPNTTGMTVLDNAAIEPAQNYAIDIEGYINTGATSTILSKPNALSITTTGAGITATNLSDWSKDRTGATDAAGDSFHLNRWFSQTFTTTSAYNLTYITFPSMTRNAAATDIIIELYATDGAGKPTGAALGSTTLAAASGPYTSATFAAPPALANATLYALVWRCVSANPDYWGIRLDVADSYANGKGWLSLDGGATWIDTLQDMPLFIYDAYYVNPVLTYACAAGEYAVRVSDNATHMALYVDSAGVAPGTTLRTGAADAKGIINVATDWAFALSPAMPYMHYVKIAKAGVPVSYWDWEYGTTFTDNVSAIVATPTFRTTTSDADVTASVSAFMIVAPGEAPVSAIAAPGDFYTTPTISGATFTTGTVTPTFPGASVITALATATATPNNLPLTIITGVVILIASLSASAMLRKGGSGSLIIKITLITGLLGVAVATQIFDLWMPIVFVLIASALAMGSQQRGWD